MLNSRMKPVDFVNHGEVFLNRIKTSVNLSPCDICEDALLKPITQPNIVKPVLTNRLNFAQNSQS